MSDNFLNKLREIRQKYGISQAQYRAVEPIKRESFIDTHKSTIEPSFVCRSRSNMKRSLNPSYQDHSKDFYNTELQKRGIDMQSVSKRPMNEGNRIRNNSLIAQKTNQRSSSQSKIPLTNYNTLGMQNFRPSAQNYPQQSKAFEKTSFSVNNIQNIKILYEPITKHVSNVPPFSYTRQPLESSRNNWTIDKLSHVQDKIKAYLRK